jgi:hypothetical protein
MRAYVSTNIHKISHVVGWVGHEVEQYKIERLSEDIYLYDNKATNCESTSRTYERYAEDCE